MNRSTATLIVLTSLVVKAYGENRASSAPAGPKTATLQEAIEARTDAWGDAAMNQPDGANYKFFENLMPPVRWTDAEFRHYPIVLAAPRSRLKARVLSNGGAINARANKKPMWYEQGFPVTFYVGEMREPFGDNLKRLATPRYLDGYLPVVTIEYENGGGAYVEESFAPVDADSAAHGAAMIRFKTSQADDGSTTSASRVVEARIDSPTPLRAEGGQLLNEKGESIVSFTPAWQWDAERSVLVAQLDGQKTAELAVFTKPLERGMKLTSKLYDKRRQQCIDAWQDMLRHSIDLETPETIVNNAWRAMLIGNFMVTVDNRPHYSAGNAYAKLYQGESGDTLRSFLLFGHLDLGQAMLQPMLEYDRKDTRFHVAGHKLQLLAYFYWLTRDADTVREYKPVWQPWVELILNSREKESGLLPKDRYAGDIAENVYSLNSNANCWRGLRDVAVMLEQMGEGREARRLKLVAAAYRKAIVGAVARSERLDSNPPFIPNALTSARSAHRHAHRQLLRSHVPVHYRLRSIWSGAGPRRLADWIHAEPRRHSDGNAARAAGPRPIRRTPRHESALRSALPTCPAAARRPRESSRRILRTVGSGHDAGNIHWRRRQPMDAWR
jgi:hypothetical protein